MEAVGSRESVPIVGRDPTAAPYAHLGGQLVTGISHLRLVASGGYVPDVPLLAREIWACNINLLPTLSEPSDIHVNTSAAFQAAEATLQDSDTGWTCNANFLREGGVNDLDPVDYLVQQAMPAWSDFISGGNGSFSFVASVVELRQLELYAIDSLGHVIDLPTGPAKAILDLSTTIKGAAGGAGPIPLQTSVGMSWVSAANTPRGRGRIYPPAAGQAVIGSSGVMSDATCQGYADGGAELIGSLRMGSASEPYVRPIVIGSPYSTAYVIKRVRVGSILDTQRRRVNQLAESYKSADVA